MLEVLLAFIFSKRKNCRWLLLQIKVVFFVQRKRPWLDNVSPKTRLYLHIAKIEIEGKLTHEQGNILRILVVVDGLNQEPCHRVLGAAGTVWREKGEEQGPKKSCLAAPSCFGGWHQHPAASIGSSERKSHDGIR